MKFKRIFLIVLDSLGVGEADDAYKFNDVGANTFKHTKDSVEYDFDNLKSLGLYDLVYDTNYNEVGFFTKANPISIGKDTLTGHLEIMGIETKIPFKTFHENGFPKDLIIELENKTNRKVLGNISASGTEIIEVYGKEHISTGGIIVYTSADSVLQIAAHEEIISVNELYNICKIAREITLKDEWKVGRVIARPFIGEPGKFIRTENRKDYALDPEGTTVLDNLIKNNYEVISIGKIADIYNDRGISQSYKTKDNLEGINKILDIIDYDFVGLCFANLNDFDSLYGHRRNKEGYATAIKEFDNYLPSILNNLNSDDLLIITADHGNDPTYSGTDHTREKVPVLIYSKLFEKNGKLEDLNTFADIGATIADNFNVDLPVIGKSFLNYLKEENK
ncbi:MAG TPA: phosphopentomutase [Tenericutes bacterium]|nr:phosphopentomutase [Mycoplasmatota bacterium]